MLPVPGAAAMSSLRNLIAAMRQAQADRVGESCTLRSASSRWDFSSDSNRRRSPIIWENSLDARTRALLEAPILPTLLRLAFPNVVMTLVQASTGLIEAYFIGMLGTDALAGAALVVPAVMLMQMMSAGAMGGGVSSAIARALGGGRREDANALVAHAFIIAIGFAAFFSLAVVAGGARLYGALGGEGPVLAAALSYSDTFFCGVVLLWLFNTLANVIRGTGNTLVPAVVTIVGAGLLIPLSPCLIFGVGPFPRLGIAGGAAALLTYYTLGAAAFAAYLWSGRSVLTPHLCGVRLRWPLFWDILRIGAAASLIALMTNVDDRADHGARLRLWSGRHCRLRRRHAAGISVDPADVRLRWCAGRVGRHQHRRWPARAGDTRGLARRLRSRWR